MKKATVVILVISALFMMGQVNRKARTPMEYATLELSYTYDPKEPNVFFHKLYWGGQDIQHNYIEKTESATKLPLGFFTPFQLVPLMDNMHSWSNEGLLTGLAKQEWAVVSSQKMIERDALRKIVTTTYLLQRRNDKVFKEFPDHIPGF
jgi:hypothetical protein